jgi:hypothetical protein
MKWEKNTSSRVGSTNFSTIYSKKKKTNNVQNARRFPYHPFKILTGNFENLKTIRTYAHGHPQTFFHGRAKIFHEGGGQKHTLYLKNNERYIFVSRESLKA